LELLRIDDGGQRDADDHVGDAVTDHLRDGAVAHAVECDGERGGDVCVLASIGDGPRSGIANAERDVHSDRHDQLQHGDGDGDAGGEQGDADDHMGDAVTDHLRDGAIVHAVECDGERAGDVSVLASIGDGARSGIANAERDVHSDRHDRLQRGDGDGDADGDGSDCGLYVDGHGQHNGSSIGRTERQLHVCGGSGGGWAVQLGGEFCVLGLAGVN